MRSSVILLCFVLLYGSAQAATLTDLVDHVGQYPFDFKLFNRPAFKARVTKLIGTANYATLEFNTSVTGPIGGNRIIVFISGNAPHMGGSEEGMVLYDSSRDALKVWLKTGHKLMTFEEDRFVDTRLFSKEVNNLIQSFYSN